MGSLNHATILLTLADQCTVRSVTGDLQNLLGFVEGDLLSGKIRLQDRFHREDEEIAARLFSPSAEVDSAPFHLRLRAADGRIRCLLAHAGKRAETSGAIVLELLLQDVRELRCPESAGLAANFSTLIENTRDIVYIKDRNHVLLEGSKYLADLASSAQSAADLVGKTDYDLFPEPLADISYRNEERAIAEGRRASEVVEVTLASGQKVWFDDRKYPLNDQQGKLVGILGIAVDVTVRIQAEQALRESKELLRLFVEHAPAALAMFDREMRYMAVSRRWMEKYPFLGGELIGKSCYEVFSGMPERWKDEHRRALDGEAICF
jgi:PAS domain S-box-containing protein